MLALLVFAHLFCASFHTASAATTQPDAAPPAAETVSGEAALSALEPAPRDAEGPLCDEAGGVGVDQRSGAAQFPAWLAIGLATVVVLWLAPPPPATWRPCFFAPVAALSGTRLLASLCILRV
ncbi:hypothetical protein EKD16_22085 [Streptomonospora litoralis]|uniref:Uncharacterized protein n=1 Tax=Streptomonospora litoralis TaxID=2498135 RepID=A0A4P6Q738_9ACTN|nr:hypothetical protein EKD16_22085 [Streptomonospora litoralis]